MLIIALLKGVPARTTQVVEVGGVLNREAMDIVLNPHDAKAIEAADFLKRRVGGKVVALSMGPDMKLIPIMKPLFDAEVSGVDEQCVLSDRKMAGSDTLATSYAVSLGVKKVVERHVGAIDELMEAVKKDGYSDALLAKASALYAANLLPNEVFSSLPAVRGTIMHRFMSGELSTAQALEELAAVKESLQRFIVVSGVKTTDGETGSVGPQVSEGVSELMGNVVPHATYVEDFEVDEEAGTVVAARRLGYLLQTVEMRLPALLTVYEAYRPREVEASRQPRVRENNYKGKVFEVIKWTADDLRADPTRLGFQGSPTIVGPGVDIGKPPVQKFLGRSTVFLKHVDPIEQDGKRLGPFERGDLADGLPTPLIEKLRADGVVGGFDLPMLVEDLFP
jgi:electron transfer flavoprotein beta subunit